MPGQPTVGQILVATEKSHDPDLAHSVILIIYSDPNGLMGLILNRPQEKAGYFGGPIPLGTRTLFRSRTKPADAQRILDEVFMVSKEAQNSKEQTARVYAGYAGWTMRQLMDEIDLGLWKVMSGAAAMIFDPHPETLWQRLPQ
jgi:putative transcriptional regulator